MECKEFIESTILKLENKWFDELKKLLIEKKHPLIFQSVRFRVFNRSDFSAFGK